MAEATEVCPDCGSTKLQNRVAIGHVETDSKAQYRCNDCGNRFDQPAERPAENHGIPGAGSKLGSTLAEMDPEDAGLRPLDETVTGPSGGARNE